MSSWWNDRENKQELQIDGFWLDSFSLEKKSLSFLSKWKVKTKLRIEEKSVQMSREDKKSVRSY